jgi:hypothetical protein
MMLILFHLEAILSPAITILAHGDEPDGYFSVLRILFITVFFREAQ